jgi:nucleotide-binding universal stress UspA family protein
MPIQIHLMGLMLALLFTGSMGGLLLWMLWLPVKIPAAAAKARRSVIAIKRILVPTVGLPYSERAVELACRLGHEQKAEVVLVHVVEVPRTMPLGVPLPEAEAEATKVLERAESIVTLHGLKPKKMVQRARIAGEEIARIAAEQDVDMIVLGARAKIGLRDEILGRTSDLVLRHASCEVIVDKLPGSESS